MQLRPVSFQALLLSEIRILLFKATFMTIIKKDKVVQIK